MPSSHLILCRPLLLLPPIPPSIRVFSSESTLRMRWPKYWSLSFSIIPSKDILGLISFRMDWLDLLAVQGTLKSLLQHHSSVPKLQAMVHQPLLSGSKGAGFRLPLPGLASDLSDWAPAWASLTFTTRGRFSPFLRVLQALLALMGGQLLSGLWGASPCLWPWAPVCHRRPRCLPSGASRLL